MNAKAGVSEAAGPSRKGSASESLLFINMSNPSHFSQPFNQKQARSHIMSRYHQMSRGKRAVKPTRKVPSPECPRQIVDKESLPLEKANCFANATNDSMINGFAVPKTHMLPFQPKLGDVLENEKQPEGFHMPEQSAVLVEHKTPEPPRFNLFSNIRFPFELTERDEYLLFHYYTVFNYTNIPVNPKDKWLRFAVTDDALLHTTLIISALHIALIRGKTFSVDAFRHQTKVTRVLNNRLNNQELRDADSTILAISCLALLEILNASPLAAGAHIEALQQLINRRGGLATLGLSGIVRRKVLWADLSSAIARETKPHFPYSPDVMSARLPSDSIHTIVDAPTTNIYTEVSSLKADPSNTRRLCAIIQDLQRLSLVIESANRRDIAEMDRLMLSDHFYDVERRACDLLQVEGLHPPDPVQSASTVLHDLPSALYRACCLIGIIYSYVGLREIPPQAGIFIPLVANLTQIVRNIDIQAAYATYPKILLWVLSTGGIAAKGRDERHQYGKFLADLCEEGLIPNAKGMMKLVQGSIRVTTLYLAECLDLWNEVEELQIIRDLCEDI